MEYCSVSIIDGKIVINKKEIIKKRKIVQYKAPTERVIVRNDIPYVITVKEEPEEYLSDEFNAADHEGVESNFVAYEDIIKEEMECPNCMMEFSTVEDLHSHISDCHTALRCDICFRQLKSKSGLDRHIKSHFKPEKQFECEICSAKIAKRTEFKKHLLSHNIGTRYVCELCPFVSTSKRSLHEHHVTIHMKTFKPLRFLPCPKCMLSFRNQEAYDVHQLYHLKKEQQQQ